MGAKPGPIFTLYKPIRFAPTCHRIDVFASELHEYGAKESGVGSVRFIISSLGPVDKVSDPESDAC